MKNNEKEQNYLGCIMAKQELLDGFGDLQLNDFSNPSHGVIFLAISALSKENRPFDVFSVQDWLDLNHQVEGEQKEDRNSYLLEMATNHLMTQASTKRYVVAFRDYGRRRRMKMAMLQAVSEMETHDSYETALSTALGHIDQQANEGMEQGLLTANQIAQTGLTYVKNLIDGFGKGIASGLNNLDNLTYGFRAGELITIFGPPKGGKTTAVTTMLENIALDGHVVFVVSREMGESQLAVRHFASLGNGSRRNMLLGQLDDDDYAAISIASHKMADMSLIYDLYSNTPAAVALKAMQIQRQYGRLDLIVVDHIGLMTSDKARRNRFEEVTDITWALKTMARTMNVPVIQVAQQNRKYGERKDKTPQLTDLAESSSIEKDSDLLIGVLAHRDGEMAGMTELHVVGARMGEMGMAPARYRNGRLYDLPTYEYESARSRAEARNGQDKQYGSAL